MRKLVLFFLLLWMSILVACSKKPRSIEKMAASRDINGLSAVITTDKESNERRLQAAHALVQLDLANRLMENIEKLGPQNPQAAKELVAKLAPELIAQMKNDSSKSVMARDALITLFPRLPVEAATAVADAVLSWMAANMDKRADCGNFKLLKILEIAGESASENVLANLAKKHAAWMLADFQNRGEDGNLVFKRANPDLAGVKPGPYKAVYQRYWKYFRKEVLDAVVAVYDITAPMDRQVRDITIIVDYAQGEERKIAGARILEQMKTTKKATAMSVRAVGELSAPQATAYLKTLLQPSIPKDLRDAAFDAVFVIRDDPAACEALYELAKPMFQAFLRKDVPGETQLPLAMLALKGLMLARKCEIAASEYRLLRDAFKMKMEGTLFELRKGMMPALHRLMLVTGTTQALSEILSSLRFPMSQAELGLVAQVMNSLPEDQLLPAMRKNLTDKRVEVTALAILTLALYGKKDDLVALEGMKVNKTPIPGWGKTLGDLATDAFASLQKHLSNQN